MSGYVVDAVLSISLSFLHTADCADIFRLWWF